MIALCVCACVCVQPEEWQAALPMVRHAGETWANSLALRKATFDDFDDIDRNRGGYIDLQEVRRSPTEHAADLERSPVCPASPGHTVR